MTTVIATAEAEAAGAAGDAVVVAVVVAREASVRNARVGT